MKKIIHILIMIALVTFTACSSSVNVIPQGTEIKTNNIPITESSKSETRYTLVESKESDYEFITTLTQSDLTDLIPAEYKNFDYVQIESLDEGVVYISTGKGSGKDREVKDIFAYNLDSDTITHIADISKLHFISVRIFEVDGNFYFYTGKVFVMGIVMVLISLYEYIFSAIKLFKSMLDEDSSRHEE